MTASFSIYLIIPPFQVFLLSLQFINQKNMHVNTLYYNIIFFVDKGSYDAGMLYLSYVVLFKVYTFFPGTFSLFIGKTHPYFLDICTSAPFYSVVCANLNYYYSF